MDRTVFLARGLRDHLHATVEYFLAAQHEPGLAAAEQRRKQLAEMAVNLIERTLQPLARLAVDAANGVFECRQSLVQIERLGIEIVLALLRRFKLVERRQIDRPQRGDFSAEPRDV